MKMTCFVRFLSWSTVLFLVSSLAAQERFPESSIEPIDLVFVKGGVFNMGSAEWEWTGPVRAVTLDSYWVGKTEITQKTWKEVMGRESGRFRGENLPVERISWFEAVDFCNRLSLRQGLTPVYERTGTQVTAHWEADGYRLPTEAEWEYAARGGVLALSFPYSGGSEAVVVGWLSVNSESTTHPVGLKRANELGLYDMSGNVWEWCWDWYGKYTPHPEVNPRGASTGTSWVIRGGSWDYDAGYMRPVVRYHYPGGKSDNIGFRIVRRA